MPVRFTVPMPNGVPHDWPPLRSHVAYLKLASGEYVRTGRVYTTSTGFWRLVLTGPLDPRAGKLVVRPALPDPRWTEVQLSEIPAAARLQLGGSK